MKNDLYPHQRSVSLGLYKLGKYWCTDYEDRDEDKVKEQFLSEFNNLELPDYGDFTMAIDEAKRKAAMYGTEFYQEFTHKDMCFLLEFNSIKYEE